MKLQKHPNWKPSKAVALASCFTGGGANPMAQKLANEIGGPVLAPNSYAYYNPFKAGYVEGSARWILFKLGKTPVIQSANFSPW